MKHPGSHFEYETERNNDLLRAYKEAIQEASYICVDKLYKEIVNKPSKRFWVSEERAAIVVSQLMKGRAPMNMQPLRREMFVEIHRRVVELKKTEPQASLSALVFKVLRQPAPKFYLTPGSAKVIICKIKRAWYEKRKKHLRHLY